MPIYYLKNLRIHAIERAAQRNFPKFAVSRCPLLNLPGRCETILAQSQKTKLHNIYRLAREHKKSAERPCSESGNACRVTCVFPPQAYPGRRETITSESRKKTCFLFFLLFHEKTVLKWHKITAVQRIEREPPSPISRFMYVNSMD